ncbi:hypothetical protein evm_001792 [Chilo suppressalis]|nr:hypothetical protein evm_001792 [Chilo suppressalis]
MKRGYSIQTFLLKMSKVFKYSTLVILLPLVSALEEPSVPPKSNDDTFVNRQDIENIIFLFDTVLSSYSDLMDNNMGNGIFGSEKCPGNMQMESKNNKRYCLEERDTMQSVEDYY